MADLNVGIGSNSLIKAEIDLNNVAIVTRVAQEGDSVSGGGAWRWRQQLSDDIRGAATEKSAVWGHAPHFRGLHVAQKHSERALQLPGGNLNRFN